MKKSPFYVFFLLGLFFANVSSAKAAITNTQKPVVTSQVLAKDINIENSDFQSFDETVKNTQKLEGLFTVYRNKQTGTIYLEIKPEQLNKNYLATITLDSGIGERGLYSGMPLQDMLFYFRRVNNNLHFAVRNVNFRTSPGNPEQRSLERGFSDSVLSSLKIISIHPQRQTILVDLGNLLLSDLPGLSSYLKTALEASYQLEEDKTYFGAAKAFPLNMEIESIYGFSNPSGDDGAYLPTLPDSRALSLKVHYSLSQLPENNGYIPRLADERIGYFTTVYKDFSSKSGKDPFVRYIQRWNLEKQDPAASLSPPKKQIVFWIENTVPVEYRDAIREGVLMWNAAFEKAGFKDAIAVQQMPENATWDPADVRYNTIRWFNSLDAAFALGPSRVNPLTGEILDADIIVDADFVNSFKQEYRHLIEPNQKGNSSICHRGFLPSHSSKHGGEAHGGEAHGANRQVKPSLLEHDGHNHRCKGMQFANQMAVGSLSLSLLQNVSPRSDRMKEYIHQFVRLLIAHEVGHTLGLRHNFRGSTLLTPEELNNTDITRAKGMVSSVMDYLPPNLAPQGVKQGDYYTSKVGAYDEWAIEYGYKPSGGVIPIAEQRFLDEIAKKSSQPELAYASDEDSFDLDPTVNQYDLSGDPLGYSRSQLDIDRQLWDRLNKGYPGTGESYSEVSDRFNTAFMHYLQNVFLITKYIGGQSFYRDRPGNRNGRLPFEPVPVAKQREALAALQKYVFAEDAFNFPPDLLNKLAPSRWMDWSNNIAINRLDFPVHDSIFFPQSIVLREVLSGDRLNRLRDLELKSQPNQALTLPELFNTLHSDIWSELQPADSKSVKISSFRRALQREHLQILIGMVLRTEDVPEDARTLAWSKLRQLREDINGSLRHRSGNLDEYTKAHLQETRDRISKALDAQMQSN
ncbi:zinc-dependent metalloprotease [Coleofasciculus sp. FACHB-T130]|uniref:zinc-dependent metalloprotease n=1 Tax=Cyanophyceae TaxID=3028117 RepID=UPI00168288C7|nr:zinc-dependent metalloprotease [Coleofasciculus sp. FACHB-T130]MBD1881494.1 zinc-dependent metalloprotease [Coleofasciculus sp. FACHB-T130]